MLLADTTGQRKWEFSSAGRASALQAGCHRFEPCNSHQIHFMKIKCYGPVVQLVRTPACHAGGREFEPHPGRHMPLQLSRQSKGLKIPVSAVRFHPKAPLHNSMNCEKCGSGSVVERHLAKVNVASSNLVFRSIYYKTKDAKICVFCYLYPAPQPSGKAEVCKTFIPQFKSGWRLQSIIYRETIYYI